ncbi:MAG TPA: hypothetical protein VFY00_08685 [Arenimonas sp.]|nr:hypothetical protein [Arenimonas sp.]
MIHIVHMIQRRLDGRPIPAALPLLAVSGLALLAGLGLLLGR